MPKLLLSGARWPSRADGEGPTKASRTTPALSRTLSRLALEDRGVAVDLHGLVLQMKAGPSKWQVFAVPELCYPEMAQYHTPALQK